MLADLLLKTKKEYKNLGSRYIYQNQLDKGFFQHNMAYGDFQDFPRRAASDYVLRDKAFNIAKTLKQELLR